MARNKKALVSRLVGFGLALGLAVPVVGGSVPAAAQMFACEDESNLCLEPTDGAAWQPGKKSTSKDRKRRSRKYPGTIDLTVEGGRGSLFINGRYAGTAPVTGAKAPGGKNTIQIRDGADVLASGLLTVPKNGAVTIVVRHP